LLDVYIVVLVMHGHTDIKKKLRFCEFWVVHPCAADDSVLRRLDAVSLFHRIQIFYPLRWHYVGSKRRDPFTRRCSVLTQKKKNSWTAKFMSLQLPKNWISFCFTLIPVEGSLCKITFPGDLAFRYYKEAKNKNANIS